MSGFQGKVALVAAGHTKWGVRNATWRELVQEVGRELFKAVPDLDRAEVDSLFVGAAQPERWAFQSHVAPLVADMVGVKPWRVVQREELACASGQSAVRSAAMAIATGLSEVALCLGVEKMNIPNMAESQTSMADVLDREFDGPSGASAPPFFALTAQRHMHEYGTTEEQMALVAEKNHANSVHNEYAHFQKPISKEKVLASRPVAPPLKLFDCSGITDGAAAVLLTSAERAKEFTDTPAYLLGSGQSAIGGNLANIANWTTWKPAVIASREGYKMAGIEPTDLDFVEAHDCFSISEIIEYEDLGFCKKGEGGKYIEDGNGYIGSKVPFNPRGGLLGMGHPLGATGISQVAEVLWQFQSKVPKQRAVDGANLAMTHNLSGAANVHSVLVWGRSPQVGG
jgi:acetyl-CoA C-acetyltransferase